MQLGLTPLFDQLRRAPELHYVLATVIGTRGSSYRKAGAMMLLPPEGEPLGLVSGGCLEGDLMSRAGEVRQDGLPRVVHYDLSEDDTLWGLGLGCGGVIDVLLESATSANRYAGLESVMARWQRGEACWWLKPVDPDDLQAPQVVDNADALPGVMEDSVVRSTAQRHGAHLIIPVDPPFTLALCGAGIDAVPVASLARQLQWCVHVLDHREGWAVPTRFAHGTLVQHVEDPAQCDVLRTADAVIIMAHHLQRDAGYVKAALAGQTRYVGLLGPVARREQVMALAGCADDARLFGPAGLDLGATLPETIALSIIAQIQAVLAGRAGGSLAS